MQRMTLAWDDPLVDQIAEKLSVLNQIEVAALYLGIHEQYEIFARELPGSMNESYFAGYLGRLEQILRGYALTQPDIAQALVHHLERSTNSDVQEFAELLALRLLVGRDAS